LSAWFEATRQDYYGRLLGVTQRGEWEEWIDYFLAGVTNQARDALDRIRRIDDQLARWRAKLARESSRVPERALDLLAESPFWTVKDLAERLDVAFTTAQRAVDRLESAGVVSLVREAKRNRVYCAQSILEILEEPARMADDNP
jgi:Fic family protein